MSQNKTHVEISFWRALYRTTTAFLIIVEYLICNLMLIVFTIFFEIFIMCYLQNNCTLSKKVCLLSVQQVYVWSVTECVPVYLHRRANDWLNRTMMLRFDYAV